MSQLKISVAVGWVLLGTAFLVTARWLPPAPMWNAAMRLAPAGLLLLAVRPGLPRGRWWGVVLVLGLLNFGGFFFLQATAAHQLPGGVGATIGAMMSLVVPFLAIPLLGERPSLTQVAAAGLGVSGVALLLLRGVAHPAAPGILAAFGMLLCNSLGAIMVRRLGRPSDLHYLTLTGWQMLLAGAAVALLAPVVEGPVPSMSVAAIGGAAWLALPATAVAFALVFRGLYGGLPATTVASFAPVAPLVAGTLGWILNGEHMSNLQVLGGALALGAVLLAQRPSLPVMPLYRFLAGVRPMSAH